MKRGIYPIGDWEIMYVHYFSLFHKCGQYVGAYPVMYNIERKCRKCKAEIPKQIKIMLQLGSIK